MEKNYNRQPFNIISEEEFEAITNENSSPALTKFHSGLAIDNKIANLDLKMIRSLTNYNVTSMKRNLFVMKDEIDDVQTSIMRRTNSAIERMKLSHNPPDKLDYRRFEDNE